MALPSNHETNYVLNEPTFRLQPAVNLCERNTKTSTARMAARSLDAELGTPRPRAAPPLPLHPLAPAPPSPPPSPSSAHAAAPSPPSSAGTWIAPLCDWRSEPVLCGVACCCPCITYSQLAERVFNVPGACATLTITLGILAAGFMCFSLYAAVTTVGRLAFYTKDPEYFQYYFLDLPSEYVATYVAAAVGTRPPVALHAKLGPRRSWKDVFCTCH